MVNRYEVAYGVLLLIWAVSGGFITSANVKLGSYKKEDTYLNNAYWNTFAAAFVTWTLIGIIILLIILSFVGVVALFTSGIGEGTTIVGGEVVAGSEAGESIGSIVSKKAKSTAKGQLNEKQSKKDGGTGGAGGAGISNITIGILCFSLLLVTISGILGAVSASQIAKSPNYSKDDKKLHDAYTDCIIAAVLCLGSAGLLLIVTLVALVSYERGRAKAKKIEAVRVKQEQEHALEVERLKKEHQKALLDQREQLKRAHERSAIEKAEKEAEYQEQLLAAEKEKRLKEISGSEPPIKPVREISKRVSGVNDPILIS